MDSGPRGRPLSRPRLTESIMTRTFGQDVRERQLAWALDGHIPEDALERRRERASHVLKNEHQQRNLFNAEWWKHIAGKEHRWVRALNSSQCFAINLFAPLHGNEARARSFLRASLKARDIRQDDRVFVEFEFTPDDTKDWLGEKEQPTQIDVYFKIERLGQCVGHVVVEVKYTETSFGCCRGWNATVNGSHINPKRDRCRDVSAVVADPDRNCWLTEVKGRRYWEILSRPDSSIRMEAIRNVGACPFRYGLYQMMRNRVLADELATHTRPSWADFVVCHHPDNKAVFDLKEAVSSHTNAVTAFISLSSDEAVRVWDAAHTLETIRSTDAISLAEWHNWMLDRYF